jgi:AcrR family transcriptional regulator
MARIVKDADVRQNEILDTAQMLFYTKGYEKTAVRDIINEVGIAKGTFYHHFNSKADLLDASIIRLVDHALVLIEPILADEQMTALEKLHSFFDQVGNFKIENEAFIRSLLPTWYQDSNAIMREKSMRHSKNTFAPLFDQIIQQGIAEGVFNVKYPEEIGGIVLQTMYAITDNLARIMIDKDNRPPWHIIKRRINAYNAAIDSLLGAAPGSVHLFELDAFRHWFDDENDND